MLAMAPAAPTSSPRIPSTMPAGAPAMVASAPSPVSSMVPAMAISAPPSQVPAPGSGPRDIPLSRLPVRLKGADLRVGGSGNTRERRHLLPYLFSQEAQKGAPSRRRGHPARLADQLQRLGGAVLRD